MRGEDVHRERGLAGRGECGLVGLGEDRGEVEVGRGDVGARASGAIDLRLAGSGTSAGETGRKSEPAGDADAGRGATTVEGIVGCTPRCPGET